MCSTSLISFHVNFTFITCTFLKRCLNFITLITLRNKEYDNEIYSSKRHCLGDGKLLFEQIIIIHRAETCACGSPLKLLIFFTSIYHVFAA
jgi:hypothetical protein